MNAIHIQQAGGPKTAHLDVEIVERKGVGHPDSMCDAIMEDVSRALSRAYRDRAGTVLHHNCDKALLVAGQVELRVCPVRTSAMPSAAAWGASHSSSQPSSFGSPFPIAIRRKGTLT